MENLQNLWSGFTTDKAGTTTTFDNLEFGLNVEAKVLEFKYNTNTGVGNTLGNPALEVEVAIGSNKINKRWYSPTKIYFENNEIDSSHPEYGKQFIKEVSKVKGVITHWLKGVGYTEEQIQQGLAATNSFESLCNLAASMMNAVKQTKKVDLFLQYQYSLKGQAKKTYLEIPNTLGYGAFITESIAPVGKWNKVDSYKTIDEEGVEKTVAGLAYQDEAGNYHRFVRAKNFLDTTFAKQQSNEAPTTQGISNTNSITTSKAVTW